jgi:hypothetical protein
MVKHNERKHVPKDKHHLTGTYTPREIVDDRAHWRLARRFTGSFREQVLEEPSWVQEEITNARLQCCADAHSLDSQVLEDDTLMSGLLLL